MTATRPFEAPRFAPGDAVAVAVALLAHIAVFALLSASFLTKPDMIKIQEQPIDVTLSDTIGLVATAPQSTVAPAQSVAPEIGKPDDAPPPAPAAPSQTANRPAAKPAPDKPQTPGKAMARNASLPDPSTFRKPSTGSNSASTSTRPRGVSLGDDFLKGLDDKPSKSKSTSPRAVVIDAQALASIQEAISRQIQPCADRQVNPGPGANRIVTTLNLRLNADGSLSATPAVVRQAGLDGENDRYARRVIDLGVAAFKGCSPLRLPPEFYSTPSGGWNNINYNWQLR